MSLDLSMFERFAKTFDAGQIIFCEYEPGDSFYLIQSGRVKIVKIFGSIEKTIDILKPGEFFGEMALLENAPRSASIIALDDCKLLEFNRSNFEVLMTGNPQMALKLLGLFAKRIHDQKRRFSILTLADEHARVADVFVMLAEELEVEDEEADIGKRVFNHSVADIAHWAGMTPDRCREILNHFQEQRRVSVYKKHIEVTNIHDLIRFVSSRRKVQENQDGQI
ncbi:MAG: Crp/Fnr family transcriptional regulator [Spirochaetaceae bacterium]|nr:Crp/Fnr family transcriptional regulator [Spirochaetaceae bacterium]